eukprot:1322868-Amorphochlora_amoeboformis.AAC.2
MSKKTQLNFKLVLLGDAAVGKSSCVERFVKNEFFEFQQPTIGAAFLTQTIPLDEYIVKFEIWDTAGGAHLYCHSNAPPYTSRKTQGRNVTGALHLCTIAVPPLH